MRTVLALIAMAGAAWAQDIPSEITGLFGGGDEIRLERITAASYHLTYTNSGRETSRVGVTVLAVGDLVVDVEIRFGAGAAERIIARPRGAYMATPDSMDVEDGDSFTVQIMPAMF